MQISVLLSSPLDFATALEQVRAIGFTHIDVIALAERPSSHLDALAESGLVVACAALGRGLPDGSTLDAPSVLRRREALEEIKKQVTDAARLGATDCYLVPGADPTSEARTRFTEACCLLGDYAGQRMMRLCVEHMPGRALSSATDTLAWLEEVAHGNLHLLLDVGHCLLTRENPARIVEQAGERLGYVHLDDNDGVSDLHWPLLTGNLTEKLLVSLLTALRKSRYAGALSLELRADSPDPLAGLRDGKRLLERLLQACFAS